MTRARDVANVLSTATALATDTETAAAISSHNSANDPHGDRANAATLYAPLSNPTFTAIGGDEGGQINLATAATNSTLSGPINLDVWRNRIRLFEGGGNNRGAFIDLSTLSNGVGSELIAAAPQSGNSGKYLTTNGTTASWGTVSSGYNLISRQTFTGTGAQTFDNIFSSTYDNYQIVLLYGNNNETADLNMQFRYGATPTTQTQYYNYGYTKQNPNGGALTNVGNVDASGIRLTDDTGTQFIVHMFISLYSDRLWGGYFATGFSNNGNADSWGIRGNFSNRFARSGADIYHGLYFFNTAGSATGSISIYGQAKS